LPTQNSFEMMKTAFLYCLSRLTGFVTPEREQSGAVN